MATAKQSRPSPGVPKTIGVLNLLFGGALLLCGMGCLGTTILPGLIKYPEYRLDPQVVDREVRKMRKEQIEELKEQEAAASTDAEKAKLRKEREEWEVQSAEFAKKIDLVKLNEALRRLWLYLAFEVITAPLLNFLMLVSGIGLILLQNWARLLAIGVAVLKVLRLIALGVFATVFVWPALTQVGDDMLRTELGKSFLNKVMEEQSKQRQGNAAPAQMAPEDFVQLMKASSMATTLLFYSAGLVYPVIALVLLSLPGARLACARRIDEQPEFFPDPDAFA